MKHGVKTLFTGLWHEAMSLNKRNILRMLEKDSGTRMLDLGCDDGAWTGRLAGAVGTRRMVGLDLPTAPLDVAAKRGIAIAAGDLNAGFPFADHSFDLVHANQVVEHLFDVDNFAREIFRTLKPGGYAVISTENLSSWHNLFALLLGFQAFSQHISCEMQIGNPLGLHHDEKLAPGWFHVKIFTLRGLKELFELHGLRVESSAGAGYYPFGGRLGALLSRTDPTHAHFITVKVRKALA